MNLTLAIVLALTVLIAACNVSTRALDSKTFTLSVCRPSSRRSKGIYSPTVLCCPKGRAPLPSLFPSLPSPLPPPHEQGDAVEEPVLAGRPPPHVVTHHGADVAQAVQIRHQPVKSKSRRHGGMSAKSEATSAEPGWATEAARQYAVRVRSE
jgi:hypothetical protein